jgi:hypothetical protein
VMAELHGAQRHRLGWSETDIEREDPLLIAEIEHALREALSTAGSSGASDGNGEREPSSEAARAAMQYAVMAARQMLEQGTMTALRSYRFAKATATP